MKYEKPNMEVMELKIEDIVRTSGLGNGGAGDPESDNWT